jgi:hypothetical protein
VGEPAKCADGFKKAAGRRDEAAEALTQALRRYERKRNLAMARRVRDRLVEPQTAPENRSYTGCSALAHL